MEMLLYYIIIAKYILVNSYRVNNIRSNFKLQNYVNQKKNGRNISNIRINSVQSSSTQEDNIDDDMVCKDGGTKEDVGTDDALIPGKVKSAEDEDVEDKEEVESLSPKPKSKFYIDKSIIYTIPHDDYVVIGKILTTYGLKGHVKVKSYTTNPEVKLCEPGYRYLKIPYNDEKVIPIKLERGKNSGIKDVYILKFEGFDTVEQSQRLSESYVTIPLAQLPPLEEDTYYSRDLIGLDLYLYNDINKTPLGKIVGFVHHSDLVSKKKYEEVCDDLIDVQINMKVSLKTLIDVTNAVKEMKNEEEDEKIKGVNIVTEREIEDADQVVDMEKEFQSPNFRSIVYIKYYECSICNKEFTNHTQALLHEKAHESKVRDSSIGTGEVEVSFKSQNLDSEEEHKKSNDGLDETKLKVISIEDIINKDTNKPIRRFYVPLVRNETVKYIDVENKSVYVDPYTIFIGEDANYR